MKVFHIPTLFLMGATLLTGCSPDDDFNVPPASSQAKYSYTLEIKQGDEGSYFELVFTNESVEAAGYLWNFGDGRTSTEENPVVIYTQEGTFEVSLTVTPVNDVYYNKLIDSKSIRLLFKETLFFEDFTLETSLSRFTLIDNDGDDNNWYWDYFEEDENGYLLSRSWSSQDGPLTPDNWIITPEIDLSGVSAGQEVFLEYGVCPTANTATYRAERYSVLISTTGTAVGDFETLFAETLETTAENWVYDPRSIDLSSYAGSKVRIAFRHFESTDNDRISIDNIELYVKF